MFNGRTTCLAASLVGLGCLLTWGASPAPAQEKNGKSEVILKKTEKLTADDEKDSVRKDSFRKVYKAKLTEGTTYRIDMTAKPPFDSLLRVEDAAGKELASNDDVGFGPNPLDSRLFFAPPKTGEYKIIATTFRGGQTGQFTLEVKTSFPGEAEALKKMEEEELAKAKANQERMLKRIDAFAKSSSNDQKRLIAELTKELTKKGDALTVPDAVLAIRFAMALDESDVKFVRDSCETISKLFDAASDKQLAVVRKELEHVLKSLDKIGKEIEITGKTTDGKDFDLKNLKGKIVLVDFWATWCGPCVGEIPSMLEAHKKYHKHGFEVIGVSLDRGDAEIIKFLDDRKLPWQSIGVEDSRKLADRYGVTAIPYPVLVGRDGRIVSTRARGPMLDRLLERYLAEKK